MHLLERQTYSDELLKIIEDVSSGNGKTVLISGEAGIGKTSLIKHITDNVDPGTEILWGGCDDLYTPRPLGPLYDIAYQVKSGLMSAKLEKENNRIAIFSIFLKYLQETPRLKIIIIEDIHWADEATLDFIKFLTRRINRTRTVLILSYRDDDLDKNNKLRSTFADLPYTDVKRIRLYPLSEESVTLLAVNAGLEGTNLYEITGGNPFYVTEILAYRNEGIPSSIKDAITSRLRDMTPESLDLLNIVSVIPTNVEIDFLKRISPNFEDHIDICIKKGILISGNDLISYRHELTRLTVMNSIPDIKKIQLHMRVLNCLLEFPEHRISLARIVHHALKSNDSDAVIKYGPEAAKQASRLGAHLLAAEHYLNVLKYSDKLSTETQIELYDNLSYECYLTGKVEEGIKAGETALEMLRKFPDPKREGEIYRKLSRMKWYNCEDEAGEAYLNKAIDIFEQLHTDWHLAMAYSNKSQTYAIREENETAIQWGQKALKLARKLNDPEIEAHALDNIGCAYMSVEDDRGETELRKSLDLSLKNDLFEHAVRAYTNLGALKLQQKRLPEADQYFNDGIEFCNEKDYYVFSLCLAGHHSKVKLLFGEWDKAVELAGQVVNKENVPPGNRLMPQTVIAIIRTRRNDPGAWDLLDNTLDLAFRMGENEKIVSIESARAEYLWLHGKLSNLKDELESVYRKVIKSKNPWTIGEIAYWLWKSGQPIDTSEYIALPYLYQINGNWKKAAQLWGELLCPYEQAMALSEGDEESMKEALEIFDQLGAVLTSKIIKQKMRESGIKSIPRGARKSTKKNPAGLTRRQVEVLNLVSKGLSNLEIGNHLYISPKTVDHHISAILGKLNLHSRTEAASFARTNGITAN